MNKDHTISMPDEKLMKLFFKACKELGMTPSMDNFNSYKKGFYSTTTEEI